MLRRHDCQNGPRDRLFWFPLESGPRTVSLPVLGGLRGEYDVRNVKYGAER
jgi:hypothetical protein